MNTGDAGGFSMNSDCSIGMRTSVGYTRMGMVMMPAVGNKALL